MCRLRVGEFRAMHFVEEQSVFVADLFPEKRDSAYREICISQTNMRKRPKNSWNLGISGTVTSSHAPEEGGSSLPLYPNAINNIKTIRTLKYPEDVRVKPWWQSQT